MSDYIKARFVGGPKHNELIECARLHQIRVPVRTQSFAEMLAYTDNERICESTFTTESYFLCRFFTGRHKSEPCVFAQYVHESLMRNGEPMPEAYDEPEFHTMPDSAFWRFIDRLMKCGMGR